MPEVKETGSKTETPVTGSESVSQEVKPVTMAEVTAAIQSAVNPLFAQLRTSQKAPVQIQTEQKVEKSDKNDADSTIQARLKTLEEGNRALQKEKINLEIRSLAAEEGIDSTRLPSFIKLFKADYGDKLEATPDGVVFKEFEGDTPKPLASLMSEFARGEGSVFKSPVSTSGARGVRTTSSTVRGSTTEKSIYDMSMDERVKLITAQNGKLNTSAFTSRMKESNQ